MLLLRRVADLLPACSKVLLVTGGSAKKNGLYAQLDSIIGDSGRELCHASAMVDTEPTVAGADALIELGRNKRVDAVVAAGGGSCIDIAKVAAALIPLDGSVPDFFYNRKTIESRGLFFIALPTTAGTGAEISSNSVLTDVKNNIKKSIRSPFMVPDAAVVDPELTLTLPPAVTAASGLDAFTQALESYTSAKANAVSCVLAESAVKKIFNNLEQAYLDGSDIASRTAMAEGSMISAMAFSQSGLGAVHGLAHPIGALLRLRHGVVCAVLLPHIMEWNFPVCSRQYSRLAQICRLDSGSELIDAVSGLSRRMNIPPVLPGLKKEHFDFIVRNCRSNSMRTNPRPMSDSDIINILGKLTVEHGEGNE